MLADPRRDDGVVETPAVAADLPEPVDGVLGDDGIVAIRVAQRLGFAPFLDLPQPVGIRILQLGGPQDLEQVLQGLPQIADDRVLGRLDLVDLRGIDVDVHNLAVLGELADLARNAVVEADTQGEQEIGLVDRVVGEHRAVHAEHLQAEEVIAGKAAQAMDGEGHGDAGLFREGA